VKKFALSLASVVLFLTAISVPTSLMADGNPMPVCPDGGPCKKPQPPTLQISADMLQK